MVEIERLLGATDEGSGTRHFQAQDCSDILRLAAFSIALAIDPTLGVRGAPLPPENRAAPWAFREGR